MMKNIGWKIFAFVLFFSLTYVVVHSLANDSRVIFLPNHFQQMVTDAELDIEFEYVTEAPCSPDFMFIDSQDFFDRLDGVKKLFVWVDFNRTSGQVFYEVVSCENKIMRYIPQMDHESLCRDSHSVYVTNNGSRLLCTSNPYTLTDGDVKIR